MNNNEEWRDVVGYEGYYQVSNMGRVRSIDHVQNGRHYKGRVISQHMEASGYMRVTVSAGKNKHKNLSVHRLVAMAFISNPNGLPSVNHKDETHTNNCVDNLEWCTAKYNSNYGTIKTRLSHSLIGIRRPNLWHSIVATSLTTGKQYCFESMTQAANNLGITEGSLSMAFKCDRGTVRGYAVRKITNWTTELFLCRAHNEGTAQ